MTSRSRGLIAAALLTGALAALPACTKDSPTAQDTGRADSSSVSSGNSGKSDSGKDASTGGGSTSGESSTGKSGSGGASNSNASACTPKNATMDMPSTQDIPNVSLTLTNKGKSPCKITGFPSITVVHTNEDGGTALTLNDGQKTTGSARQWVLNPGDSVATGFNYKVSESCDAPPKVVYVKLSGSTDSWDLNVPSDMKIPMCEGPITVRPFFR